MAANVSLSPKVYDHGTVVDKQKGKMKCNYCGKVVSGSTRLKCHLGGIRGDVTPCQAVPETVKEVMRNMILENKKGYLSKEVGELDHPNLPLKRNWFPATNNIEHDSTSTSGIVSNKLVKVEPASENDETKTIVFPKRTMGFQPAFDDNEDQSLLDAKKCIGRFFYETGIDFSAATVPSFQRMISSTLGSQYEHKTPTCQELKGWILQSELKEMQQYVQEIKSSWTKTGCSILLDGWVDGNGRELVNVIVDCSKGAIYLHSFDISAFVGDFCAMHSFLDKVLHEVGVGNVVQIISYSTTEFMRTFGEQLVDKYRTFFWTACASHCIALMLDEMGMMNSINNTIEKAKTITRFIYNHAFVLKLLKNHTQGCDLVKLSKNRSAAPFVTLENILLKEDNLRSMFTSSNWKTSTWATTDEGKIVSDLVRDCTFWTEARNVLNATIPLVRVLDLINEGNNQLIGYIYETMDQAKETIKDEFRNKKSQYMPFWEVIDDVWNNRLHSHLHSAGCFLNPSLLYSTDFSPDMEVITGLLCCVVRMAESKKVEDTITQQLVPYREALGKFGSGINQRSDVSPVAWWETYGGSCPELQKLAIRVLSQTCNGASRYALNRNMAEKLLEKGRNHIEQQRLCDLVFLHYNMHLGNVVSGVTSNKIVPDEIDPMDDWIACKAQAMMSLNDEMTWMDLDVESSTSCRSHIDVGGPSGVSANEGRK